MNCIQRWKDFNFLDSTWFYVQTLVSPAASTNHFARVDIGLVEPASRHQVLQGSEEKQCQWKDSTYYSSILI